MYFNINLGFTSLIFTPTLSWVILPLFAFLYYNYERIRPVVYNTLICIAIIGSMKTIQERNTTLNHPLSKRTAWQYYSGLLFHLSLLIILKDFNKYGYLNKYSLLLMIIECLFLYFLPWWPYPTSTKKEFITYLIIINLILYIAHYFLNDRNNKKILN